MNKKMSKGKGQLQFSRNDTQVPDRDHAGESFTLAPDAISARLRANSSDIAEERGVFTYPNTKKGEGKILRPQYKDILKGEYEMQPVLLGL